MIDRLFLIFILTVLQIINAGREIVHFGDRTRYTRQHCDDLTLGVGGGEGGYPGAEFWGVGCGLAPCWISHPACA